MARPKRFREAILLAALLACGCRGEMDPPAGADDKTTSWRITVTAQDGTPFGARMLLNGEQVYLAADAVRSQHDVDVTRPHVVGQNLIEVEIVSAATSPAVYVAACSARVSLNGRALIADGIPWTLDVGERLFLRVPL